MRDNRSFSIATSSAALVAEGPADPLGGPAQLVGAASGDASEAIVVAEPEARPLGHLDHLIDAARAYAASAKAGNTRRAYGADWRAFDAWCKEQGLASMPAPGEVVAL